jgi:hypothetical protein
MGIDIKAEISTRKSILATIAITNNMPYTAETTILVTNVLIDKISQSRVIALIII